MLHSLFPQTYCRFLSLPLLGPVADGFDDWLAANGYTRASRQNSIRMLLHVDAELRRRQVKKLANLTHPVLRGCWRTLRKDRPFSARTVRTLERYLAVNGLIADGQPATGTSPASMLIEEYANYLREVRGFAVSTVSNHRYTVQVFCSTYYRQQGDRAKEDPGPADRILYHQSQQTPEPVKSATRHRRAKRFP
jgi:hypothetical protein